MVIETHGPYGRKEEPNWKVELANRKSVRQVTIFVRTDTKFACGIEFVVADQNGNRKRHLIGNNNTKHKKFPTVSQPPIIMGDNEYLTQIHGMYFTKNIYNVPGEVISVGINTNLRKIEAYGEEGTQYRSSHKVVEFETPPLVDDDSILEIISTTKNSYNIRNIGVRIKTDTATYGPYGAASSLPIKKLVLDDRESLREVIIYLYSTGNPFANGIEFVVADKYGSRTHHLVGLKNEDRSRTHRIILDSDEYLTQIYGTYFQQVGKNFSEHWILSLSIYTNIRRYEPIGNGSRYTDTKTWKLVKFESPPLSDDECLVEIFATAQSNVILNIGVRIKKIEETEEEESGEKKEETKEGKPEDKKEKTKEGKPEDRKEETTSGIAGKDIETHGPFGEKENPINWKLELENRKSLREVIIYVRNDTLYKVACGIEYVVADHNGITKSHLIGRKEGTKICAHPIVFGRGEYLTQIYGTLFIRRSDNTSNIIYSIGICTNLRRYGPFGNGSKFLATTNWGCLKFETPPLSVDDSIAEIFAYNDSSSFFIHNIGVRIRKGADTSSKTTKDDKGKHSASIDIKPILKRLDAQDEMAIDIKPILKRLDAQDEMVKKVMNAQDEMTKKMISAQDEMAKKISAQDEMMKKMMEVITGLSKKFSTKKHKKLEKKLDEIDVSVSTLTRITQIGFASVACAKEEENDDEEEEDVEEEESDEELFGEFIAF